MAPEREIRQLADDATTWNSGWHPLGPDSARRVLVRSGYASILLSSVWTRSSRPRWNRCTQRGKSETNAHALPNLVASERIDSGASWSRRLWR